MYALEPRGRVLLGIHRRNKVGQEHREPIFFSEGSDLIQTSFTVHNIAGPGTCA